MSFKNIDETQRIVDKLLNCQKKDLRVVKSEFTRLRYKCYIGSFTKKL